MEKGLLETETPGAETFGDKDSQNPLLLNDDDLRPRLTDTARAAHGSLTAPPGPMVESSARIVSIQTGRQCEKRESCQLPRA